MDRQAGKEDIVGAFFPPEDGATKRALAELEARISSWTEAVADAQAALVRLCGDPAETNAVAALADEEARGDQRKARWSPGAERHEPADSLSVAGEDVASADEDASDAAGNEGRADGTEDLSTQRESPENADASESGPQAPEPDPTVGDDRNESGNEASAGSAGRPFEVTGGDEVQLGLWDPETQAWIRERHRALGGKGSIRRLILEHEEALIDALEPEVAKAIRVQRRLFRGKKTVQQLIDEYEPRTDQGRDSWWERMKR